MMSLSEKYPKLFEKFEDKDLALRHLLNVDENYEDYDSEEYEFEVDQYNYVIYVAEPVQQALGEKKMAALLMRLEAHEAFENFMPSEPDLYGVKTVLDETEIAALVLETAEALL
jgi:hypothetical protein